MERLFTALTKAMEEAPAVALAASFAWGILSVLLSPCHLASVPLIVGYMTGAEKVSGTRAFLISGAFAVGIFITIGVVGAITASLGRLVGDIGSAGSYVVAGVLFVVGLHLLGVIPMPWSASGRLSPRQKGLLGAFILGLAFGLAVGPCTFAYFMPVLGFAFLSGKASVLYGASLVLFAAAGHCSVIVGAGSAAGAAQRYLNWSESSRGTTILKKACGILVTIGGLYLIWKA